MARRAKVSVDILTLFPSMFEGPLRESLLGRAQAAGLVSLKVHDLRRWSDDARHAKVDDRPYGGGAGMVIRPEPLYRALKDLGAVGKGASKPHVVFLSPQGRVLDQKMAASLAGRKRLVFICGHYEGIDERVMEWVDQEVSIGNYVLTGGELPAMVLADAVIRLVPGVVGDPESIEKDSFSMGILDYPHYTRPSLWRGREVPEVLLSGNHAKIARWRADQALKQTKGKRPELLSGVRRSKKEQI
jgi:tRNA (guanine37-N1)-methyltransferase